MIFGGATAESPQNDLVHLDVDRAVLPSHKGPSGKFFPQVKAQFSTTELAKRTQHSSACLTDNGEMLIFSGGGMGSFPVKDQKVCN